MSEFSPDTIQFEAAIETESVPNASQESQSPLYRELCHWLSQTQNPIWQQWLNEQAKVEKLSCFLSTLPPPLHLSTMPHQLRALHAQVTPATPHADTLRQLLHHWQKQTEALNLNNRAAYEKTREERQHLNTSLAETEWPATFLEHCYTVETFLTEQADTRFGWVSDLDSPPHETLPTPHGSTRLKETDSGFVLPSQLKVTIFQRSSRAWVRRAARYLQMAYQDNFSDKQVLKKLLKSLYAALEQEPSNAPALLLLGWIFACLGREASAMACLERLHQHENHPEMIFLIRFLQNRPVL
jgi:tetratricopeptide (TPR) repeat protein